MDDTKTRGGVGRRELLAGSTLGLAAATLAGCGEAEEAWTYSTDVVCVGSGAAGLTAACTAAGNGDRVIVLEKLPIAGGTTLKSGGAAWLPNNDAMAGVTRADDEDACMRYMCRYAYPRRYSADRPNYGLEPDQFALLQAFYQNSAATERTLRELGALNMMTFRIPGSDIVAPDYAPGLEENEDIRGRTMWPVPMENGAFGGAAMIGQMEAWLASKDMPILFEHKLSGLIVEDGRVIGVEATFGEQTIRIAAAKGVILASGGFAHNEDLMRAHQPPMVGSCAAPSMTGDIVPIAARAGAAMGDLGHAWRMQAVLEEAAQNRYLAQGVFIPPADSMILVNRSGRRCVNEKRNYNDRTNAHFTYDPVSTSYPNDVMMMVFDQRAIDVFGGAYPLPATLANAPHMARGDTWEELAGDIAQRLASVADYVGDAPLADDFADQLAATVARFNGFAERGVDEDFNRGKDPRENEWQTFFSPMRPDADPGDAAPNPLLHAFSETGPYYTILIAPSVLDTCGGPKIDAQARVLDFNGDPIPGLFGAGNCVASPTNGAYCGGGGTLGPAMAFGFIAGNSVHG